MRGSAIRCVRSQCLSQWERPIFAPPPLRNPSTDFDVMSNVLLRPPQGVDVQNLVGIDLAVTDLRMREKTGFVWIFLLTYLSLCLSVSSLRLQVTVLGRFLRLMAQTT